MLINFSILKYIYTYILYIERERKENVKAFFGYEYPIISTPFFLTLLLEYNCFTMVCQFLLYNKVNQIYIYMYPHISFFLCLPPTLPIPPLQVDTKHRADLPVLCSCFPLAIYFTFGSIYMSMPLSHFVLAYPSPSPWLPFSMSVPLFLSCPQVLQNHFSFFFRFHIYVLAYGICFSLSALLHSV